MTFKQVLVKAAENNITAWRLMVADEVDCYLDGRDFSVDDDTFEAICEFVYDWCINTEATPYEIVSKLVETIKDHEQFEFTAESINANWQELTEIINLMF